MDVSALFRNRAIMAPMAGINTPAFCEILRDLGCPVIYTGLLTSHGLVHRNRKTNEYLESLPEGVALVGQIFGAAPEIMAEAALLLESAGRFAAIDVNMGCPAPKVMKTKAGVSLMREPELAGRIVSAVAGAVRLPVTVKMRSGWSAEEINCLELAERCAGHGAAAVALHPRPQTQGFSGAADWELVARMKERLGVPVIGSGDVDSPETAARRIAETGCDAVMIGRAARGDPGLPGRTQKLLDGHNPGPPPSFSERIDTAIRHFDRHLESEGAGRGVLSMRGHLAWYLKGMPGASKIRFLINRRGQPAEITEILLSFKHELEKRLPDNPACDKK